MEDVSSLICIPSDTGLKSSQLKILGAQLQILGAPLPKENLVLQEEHLLRFCISVWAYLKRYGIQSKQIRESEYFIHELSLHVDMNH